MNELNEVGPNGLRESNFRRDVRDALGMHPLDRDERLVAEIKRLKAAEAKRRAYDEEIALFHGPRSQR